MNDEEMLLSKLESNGRSFRAAFCIGLAGLTTIVAANARWGVPDVIRTKAMNVLGDGGVVAVAGVNNHKVVVGTLMGSTNLVSAGEGSTGAGVLELSGGSGKDVVRLSTVKNGGGSVGINGPDAIEIANASPNITSCGSLFIDNLKGSLIGEINGDKTNGGAIVIHNAQGTETARVHK
jgi:hypothetical protein